MQLFQFRTPLRSFLGGVLLCLVSAPTFALSPQQLDAIESSASEARKICLKEMHHDTDEFVAYVDNLSTGSKVSVEKKLGYSYLGLIGCISANRISTLHSDICSKDYLVITDRLMKELKAKDHELCAAVAGDCTMRITQIKSLRKLQTNAVKK